MTLPKLTLPLTPAVGAVPRSGDDIRPQGCNPFLCAGKVIECATACLSGVGAPACIVCLGSAYEQCKDCF